MWRLEFLGRPRSRTAQAATATLLYCALAFFALYAPIDPSAPVVRRSDFLRALEPALHHGEFSSRQDNPVVRVSQ